MNTHGTGYMGWANRHTWMLYTIIANDKAILTLCKGLDSTEDFTKWINKQETFEDLNLKEVCYPQIFNYIKEVSYE